MQLFWFKLVVFHSKFPPKLLHVPVKETSNLKINGHAWLLFSVFQKWQGFEQTDIITMTCDSCIIGKQHCVNGRVNANLLQHTSFYLKRLWRLGILTMLRQYVKSSNRKVCFNLKNSDSLRPIFMFNVPSILHSQIPSYNRSRFHQAWQTTSRVWQLSCKQESESFVRIFVINCLPILSDGWSPFFSVLLSISLMFNFSFHNFSHNSYTS